MAATFVTVAIRMPATIDGDSLRPTGGWTAPGPISALGDDSDRLYEAVPGSVEVVDGSTGDDLRSIPSPDLPGVEYVGVAAP